MDTELASAHHESSHAVAIVWAFRTATWLPLPPPAMPVRYIKIDGGNGACVGKDVYSPSFGFAPDLMMRQCVIHLAGGIGEAMFRGVRNRHEVLRFAKDRCCMDGDLFKERALLHDLRKAGGVDFSEQGFVDRALVLLLLRWPAVTALAQALAERGRIGGKEALAIIAASYPDASIGQPPLRKP
jgi:hypothetical protein